MDVSMRVHSFVRSVIVVSLHYGESVASIQEYIPYCMSRPSSSSDSALQFV
jgi:hypothetical protein